MKINIDKNISTYPQIKGFGEEISTFNLMINVGDQLDLTDKRRFILALEIIANGYTYNYNNIYTAASVDAQGEIIIGEVTVIGTMDTSHFNIQAKVIYIDEASY